MLDYKLLEALALVVREGGFERAAQALHLTQSAVSQRVRLLETQLGRPLLVRATPPYATESGRELLRHYNQARLLEDELAERLAPREESGFQRLPLAVNADSLAIWFLEALAPLLAEQRILLDLTVDDQERTHEQLERGEVAGCLSTLPEPVRGTRLRAAGRDAVFLLRRARVCPVLVHARAHPRDLAPRPGRALQPQRRGP